MLTLAEHLKQQIDEAAQECATAFARGSAPMLKLIAQKTRKGSVATRVRYVLGGIRAINSVDPELLKNYFEALWSRVPRDEEAMHMEALNLVLDQLKEVIVAQTCQHLQALAEAMRLDEQVQFVPLTQTVGAQQSIDFPAGEPDQDDEERVLH